MLIPNKSNITYSAILPDSKRISEKTESNTVITEILSFSVSKAIRSDKTTVRVGENVRNTIVITNHSTTKLFRNYFTVPQTDGASFVEGSVKINGVAQPTYNPLTGFELPDLKPDETIIIEYEIKAEKPTTAPIKNIATLRYSVNDPARGNVNYYENTDTLSIFVISDNISVIKTVDKSFAIKGEKLHYTVTVKNTGNITKTDLVFKDEIPDGTIFVANSIKIDGTTYSAYNPKMGFTLRSLTPNETLTVEFDVKVL